MTDAKRDAVQLATDQLGDLPIGIRDFSASACRADVRERYAKHRLPGRPPKTAIAMWARLIAEGLEWQYLRDNPFPMEIITDKNDPAWRQWVADERGENLRKGREKIALTPSAREQRREAGKASGRARHTARMAELGAMVKDFQKASGCPGKPVASAVAKWAHEGGYQLMPPPARDGKLRSLVASLRRYDLAS